eukprot:gene7842-12315_t
MNSKNIYIVVREACRQQNLSLDVASKYIDLFHKNSIFVQDQITDKVPKEIQETVDEEVLSILTLPSGIRFNKNNQNYVVTPNLTNLFNASTTIHIEITFNSFPSGGCLIDELGSVNLNSNHHDSQIEVLKNGEVFIRVWNLTKVSVGKIKFGTWNTVSLVYDENIQSLYGYLNGVKSHDSSYGPRQPPYPKYGLHYGIGSLDTTSLGNTNYFDGYISSVKIWKDAKGPYKFDTTKNLVIDLKLNYLEAKNGSFVDSINQTVANFKGKLSEYKIKSKYEKPKQTQYQIDIGSLFESKLGSDVQLNICNQKILAHKSILACRSEYFKHLLFTDFMESKMDKIDLDGIDDLKSFETCLQFIYSNQFPILKDPKSAFDLYVCSDSLLLKELSNHVAENFKYLLDADNFEDCLILCSSVECKPLRDGCIEYLKGEYQSLCKKTNFFENLKKENPALLQDIIKASI